MAIIQSGVSGSTTLTVDPTYAAARVSPRPIEQLNTYSLTMQPATVVSTAAGAVMANMRWIAGSSGSAQYAIIQRIAISAITTTGLTALQEVSLGVYFARSYSVPENTNITSIIPSGNNQKFRTNLPTSQFASTGQIGITTAAAAGIGGGTKVVDTYPMFVANGVGTTAIGSVYPLTVVYDNYAGDTPIVLGSGDGLTFQNMILMPAAGIVKYTIVVEWTESASTSTNSF